MPFLLIYCGAVILLWTNSETNCECRFEQIRIPWFESFNEYAYRDQNYLMNTHILLRIIYNQSNRHHSWKKWILMNLSYIFQSFNKNPEWIYSSQAAARLGAWFWSAQADIFFTESLRILAERLSQSEIGLPLRRTCCYSSPERGGSLLDWGKACWTIINQIMQDNFHSAKDKIIDVVDFI